ncbi:dGTPase [Marinomonas sp. THO17]|uniref:dGTPase n=1 Tax=Marinomonas sp. THO17 TaxID=3149048 RepID=UPI00336BBFFC
MDIHFTQKIRTDRLHNTRPNDDLSVAPLSVFESDRGRIINSAAIRRLQQKTQVFPLERNAAVRSRLTHSMEVQQVGRFISQTIIRKLAEQDLLKHYGLDQHERQFESIVEMACLMHDVGNPSFGHFGEAAINQWFSEHIEKLFERNDITDSQASLNPLKSDLLNFEGNAQALRIVHSLQTLNLTYSQLSSIIKYTRRGDQSKPDRDHPKAYLQKKVGFYLSEASIVNTINQTLSTQPGNRSPFAYIMEAADDISYCIADIEDAVEKGILKFDELLTRLKEEFAKIVKDKQKYFKIEKTDIQKMSDLVDNSLWQYKKTGIKSDFFVQFRVAVNTLSVDYASTQFIDHIQAIFDGHYNQALLEDGSLVHAVLDTLKAVAFKYVFCSEEVQRQELQGYRIIAGLLEIYLPLLQLDRTTFEQLFQEQSKKPLYQSRLFNKIAGRQLAAYQKAMSQLTEFKTEFAEETLGQLSDNAWELYFRCRLIQDYISGMTDQFAYDQYRALHVIESRS